MDQSLIELLALWAGRNPWLLALLVGPIALAVCGVLVGARRTASRPAAAPPSIEVVPAAEPAVEAVEPAVEEAEASVASELLAEPSGPPAEPQPLPVSQPVPVRLRDRLKLTREGLVGRLAELMGGRTIDAAILDELESMLLEADLGVKTADSLLATVRSEAAGCDVEGVRNALRQAVLEKLRRVEARETMGAGDRPHVILVLGVNGAGKTTSIGKLAARYRAAGRSVILGAGDTFRAAGIEQLQVWGERAGCDVIAGPPSSDPSAVAFDTVKAAVARKLDVAIIDTAGRLQTKRPLMDELGKIVRVIGRDLEGAPHEVLLVLDATTGQNAISQARLFTEAAGVTGLVLTKLDGTAKGGVLVGLADEFGIPVKYVGVGESVDDLREFSADEFVEAVFGVADPAAA